MFNIRLFIKTVLIASSLILMPLSLGATVVSLFKEYQEHLQYGENVEALTKVEQAYKLSERENGLEHPTTKILKLNFAQLYISDRETNPDYDAPRAIKLLNEYIDYEILNNGEDALALIDPLMSLGAAHLWHQSPLLEGQREFRDRVRRFGGDRQTRTKAIRDGRFKAITQFNKAIAIADKNKRDLPQLAADLRFESAKALYAKGIEQEQANKYLLQSHEIYSESLIKTDARVILTAFWLGQALKRTEDWQSSNRYFSKVTSGYEEAGFASNEKAIEAYMAMVENHELAGQSEQATELLRSLAQIQPWFTVRERLPIFQPELVIKASGDEQYAQVRFELNINSEGRVVDADVIAFAGDRELLPQITESIYKRRYIPKFKDGEFQSSVTEATVTIQ